jgi:hypothetical protein
MNEEGLRRIPRAGGILALMVGILIAAAFENPPAAVFAILLGPTVFIGLKLWVWVIKGFQKK